eukprot:TRINITY_DN6452_c0_g2_i2.p3 TRINITY_DN6452_c0_g2~~TRINITY_DN6452_c0_g2_i2.p3  ORF type:complete len:115 (-),score=11.10 TRINITY_DN6452_c0_g2_i2:25-369(-)
MIYIDFCLYYFFMTRWFIQKLYGNVLFVLCLVNKEEGGTCSVGVSKQFYLSVLVLGLRLFCYYCLGSIQDRVWCARQNCYYEQWPDFGCEGIKVQRAHQPTSQCQGKKKLTMLL